MPIWIGGYEAKEIQKAMNVEPSEGLGVYKMFVKALEALKTSVEKVVITELRDNTFYGQLVLKGTSEMNIDARPSDAICLAVRFKAPIFVKDEVLSIAAYPDISKISEEETAQGYILLD